MHLPSQRGSASGCSAWLLSQGLWHLVPALLLGSLPGEVTQPIKSAQHFPKVLYTLIHGKGFELFIWKILEKVEYK